MADRIAADIVLAMKSKDKLVLLALRSVASEFKYREIELGGGLPEEEALVVLQKAAKKRRESMALFQKGDRVDLANQEEAELKVLEKYLPQELSDEKIDAMIREVISDAGDKNPSLIGKVMSLVMPRLKGQASGDRVRARAIALLQTG